MRTPLLASLAFLVACGTTTRFVATNPSPHPLKPRPPAQVHLYTTGAPQVPYVEVGIIQSRQSSDFSTHDMPEILADMRNEAGKIGCDGVIVNGTADKTHGSTHDGNGSTNTLEGFWGACIVYLTPDESAPAATAAN